MHRSMSDSRQSPIPQDRVDENVDQAQLARDDQKQMAEQERYLKDQGIDERSGANPEEEPGATSRPARRKAATERRQRHRN